MGNQVPTLKIAVLSDTHGLLRPEVLAACTGVNAILHAGDVGDSAILEQLQRLAPLSAIRGNVDKKGVCAALPTSEMVLYGEVTLYLIHDIGDLDIDPLAAGVDVVISGHSHKPSLEHRGGVLYLNPGSVGPKRFKLPVSMTILLIQGKTIQVEDVCFNV